MGKERIELWCRSDSLGQSIGNSGIDTFIRFVCEVKGGREGSHGCGSRACIPGHTCGDQRTALWSSFSPSTFICILGVKLKSPGLQGNCLYPVSPLACPDCFEAKKKLWGSQELERISSFLERHLGGHIHHSNLTFSGLSFLIFQEKRIYFSRCCDDQMDCRLLRTSIWNSFCLFWKTYYVSRADLELDLKPRLLWNSVFAFWVLGSQVSIPMSG